MRSLTIRGGLLALPALSGTGEVRIQAGDLQITDGTITQLGLVSKDVGEIVDARGLLVMPGVIDPQVHFREPGATHKEDLASGSRACAAGGVTAFLEMPNTNPTTTTLETMAWKKARAAETSLVDYGFFIGATPDNLEVLNTVEQVCGIKVFMGSSTGTLLISEQQDLERIFAHGSRLIAVHAEDEARLLERKAQFGPDAKVSQHSDIRDAETALLATLRALLLSEKHNRRLHILHMTTKDEAELLRTRGKGNGRVSCEVCPQHLVLHAPEVYERLGTRGQMNPPIRSAEHSAGLWAAFNSGLIDCIATDHAPHTLDEKAKPYGQAPSGMPGVETSLAVMLDAAHRGLTKPERVVHHMTQGPADCYRIQRKGRLELGFDGDIALVDLKKTRRIEDGKIRSKCGWNPFEGVPLTGWPVATFVRGAAVYRDGELIEGPKAQAIVFEG
jgi:dihydroorotase